MRDLVIGVLAAAAAFGVTRQLLLSRPRLVLARRWRPVAALALLAAVGGALAGGHPTAVGAADGILRAAMAAALTVAAARARRRGLVIASGATLLVSQGAGLAVLAFVAVGMTLALVVLRRRSWVVGAAIGLCVSQVLLRLDMGGPAGASAAVAAAVGALLVVSALRRAPRRVRRRVWITAGTLGAGAVLLSGASALAAVRAAHDVRSGLDSGEHGLTVAREGDASRAAVSFDVSADAFGRASTGLDAWWARPALLVPVVGRQLGAARALSQAGQQLAAAAAQAASEVDVEGLRMRGGTVDVTAVDRAATTMSGVVGTLERSRADVAAIASPWLLGPLATAQRELLARLGQADRDARTASQVLDLARPMLGGDGPRRWFLAVVTPAEERGSGGLIGNVGAITALGGRVHLVDTRRVALLNAAVDPGAAAAVVPKLYADRYPGWTVPDKLQNALVAPDFPTAARALEAVQPLSGQGEVDGVISVDPIAVAALLGVVGPVRVPSWPVPIDASNAGRILLHDQYVALSGNAREDFLGDVITAVWDRLTEGTLPSPTSLGRVVQPLIAGRHIQLHSRHPAEQAGLVRLGADGSLPESGVDHVALVTNNAAESKADWYLHRAVDYRVRYDPGTGATEATVTVKLTNDAPPGGLPDYVLGTRWAPPGYNRQIVEVHTPLDLVSATVDGRRYPAVTFGPGGHLEDQIDLTVPPRSTATIQLRLRGSLAPGTHWNLDVGRQPAIYADDLTVTLQAAGGWAIAGTGGGLVVAPTGDATARVTLDAPRRLTADFLPTKGTKA